MTFSKKQLSQIRTAVDTSKRGQQWKAKELMANLANGAKVTLKARRKGRGEVIVDSGASQHAIKCEALLTACTRINKGIKVATADGVVHDIDRVGPVRVCTQNADGHAAVLDGIGQGMLYEKLLYSLLSVSQMCKHGCIVTFKQDGSRIDLPDGQTIPLEEREGLYFVELKEKTKEPATKAYPKGCLPPTASNTEMAKEAAEAVSKRYQNGAKPEQKASIQERRLHQDCRKLRKKCLKCAVNVLFTNPRHPPQKRPEDEATKPTEAEQTAELILAAIAQRLRARRAKRGTRPQPEPRDATALPSAPEPRAQESGRYPKRSSTADRREATSNAQAPEEPDITLRKIRRELRETQAKLEKAVEDRLRMEMGEGAQERSRDRTKAEVWHMCHRALGHAGEQATDHAVMSEKFHPAICKLMPAWYNRLTPKERLPPQAYKMCHVCARGKFERSGPNDRWAVSGETDLDNLTKNRPKPGERWHIDLTGPFPESKRGNKYLMMGVDDESNSFWGRAIPRKGDAVNHLEELKEHVERAKRNCKQGHEMGEVREICSDRGGEFTSAVAGGSKDSPFNARCKELGITQYYTSAGTSNMNGHAEGAIRIVNDTWRCSLIDSGRPMEEWDWAAEAAIHTINRRPTKKFTRRDRRHYMARALDEYNKTGSTIPLPEQGWTTRYTRFTGLEGGCQNLLPYGCGGFVSTGKNHPKSNLERGEAVTRIGVTESNTNGSQLVMNEEGTLMDTVHFQPDLSMNTGDGGPTEEELARQVRDVAEEAAMRRAYEQATKGKSHISDGEKRRRAADNNNKLVQHTKINKDPAVGRTVDFKGDYKPSGEIMTTEEAIQMAQDHYAAEPQSNLQWNQDYKKGGKSGERYEKYKKFTTFKEVANGCKDPNVMKGSKASGHFTRSSDLIFDIQHGHVKFIPAGAETDKAQPPRTRNKRRQGRVLLWNYLAQALKEPAQELRRKSPSRPAQRNEDGLTMGEEIVASLIQSKSRHKRKIKEIKSAGGRRGANMMIAAAVKLAGTDLDPNLRIHAPTDVIVEVARQMAHLRRTGSERETMKEVFSPTAARVREDMEEDAERTRVRLRDMLSKDPTERSAADLMELMHLYMITGTNNVELEEATTRFAMAAAGEIVCGKVTPDNVEHARRLPEWEQWKKAIRDELAALFGMGTFTYVKRSDMLPGKRTTKCKWVFKLKQNRDGSISRYKARKVVQGFRLVAGEDYHDKYSATMSATTFRLMSAIAVKTGQRMTTGDVGNAYLEADMDDDQIVYIEQDPEYENPDYPAGEYVLQLRKTLYGMPHSGRAFGLKLAQVMMEMGFIQCNGDKSLYHKALPDGRSITVGTYVDDLVCMTSCEELRKEWQEGMLKAFHKVTFEDDLEWMLGVSVKHGTNSRGENYISLGQQLAIEKLAERMDGVAESKAVSVPMPPNAKLHKRQPEEKNEKTYNWEYRSVLGSLMHIGMWTRPDISPAVNKLARFANDPTDYHFQLLQQVATFTYQTRARSLTFTSGGANPLKLSGASDSSFNDDVDTSRSTVGWGLWLGEKCQGLIHWASMVPKAVAISSTNAEIQGALGLAKDVMRMRTLMEDLGYTQHGSTVMYQDNDPAIQQIEDVRGTQMSKTYLVQLRKLQELLHMGKIHMNPVDTRENVADLFTKPLHEAQFWYLSQQIMGSPDEQMFGAQLRGYGRELAKQNGGGVKVRQAQKSGISHVQATLWDAENQAPEEKIFSFSLTKDQILSTDNLKASNTCPTHPSIRAYFGYLSRHE